MQRGIDFEDLVYKICENASDKDNPWYNCAEQIACRVNGGQYQLKASKDVNISGLDIVLYTPTMALGHKGVKDGSRNDAIAGIRAVLKK